VKQDLPKAIDLLKTAAAKNDPDAQFFLGTAYSSGLGIGQNDTQAVMLYEQAAQQGHAPAKLALANAVMAGRGGIAPSMNSGLRYLWESAAEGYVPAMIQIGQLYQNGKDVDRNPRAAAYWYRRVLQLIPDVRTIYNLRLLIERRQVAWEAGDPGEPLASPEKPVQTAGDGPGKGAGQAKP
jgi:TPR repeat protein